MPAATRRRCMSWRRCMPWRPQRGGTLPRMAIRSARAPLGRSAHALSACAGAPTGTRSKRGLPLIFKHFGGQCALKRALEHTTVDHLYTYNTWLNEQYTNALAEAGVSQWVVVIDAAGWNPGLVDSTAIAWLKNMADTDKEHYPERLGAIVVVNAPWLLAGLWRIIQTWRDGALPEQLAGYAARVRALHPSEAGYVHLFFTDDDIHAFLTLTGHQPKIITL